MSNGPSILEAQVDWITDCIVKMEAESIRIIEPTKEAEQKWRERITERAKQTLYPLTKSWWSGDNIEGRKGDFLTYVDGIGKYTEECWDALSEWKGFELTR